MKVLILSCSTGGGHNSCARYILEELTSNNIEATYQDFYDIVNTNAKELSSKIYLSTLGGSGEVFKNVYKLGELYSKTKVTSPVYLVNKLHKKKLYDYITTNNYDLVITTHLFPSLTLTAINKSKNHPKVNFITVATDYEPCPFFEETTPDYLIIQKDLEDRFIAKGINKDVLYSSGIPVSTNFIKNAKNIREDLSITKDEKVILVMLGSMGFGKITNILKDILALPNIKVLVVCGTNNKLLEELKTIPSPNLIPLGFVNNVNDLIYSSDIVLSKPGGLSTTEITSLRKPLLHIFPIPGIETYNTNFFSTRKMTLSCQTPEEIISNLTSLIDNPSLCKELITNQEKYINSHSAKDLIELIKKNYM